MDKDSPSSDDSSIIKGLLHFLRLGRTPDTPEDLEQEIHELLEEGEEQGLITRQEGEMINSIFEFKDTLTHEIMTPRSEMICADVSSSISEIINLITEQGFTRIPLFAETLDNIVGILHAKDLLTYCGAPLPPPLREIAKPPFLVSEKKPIVDLLRDFQLKKVHLAIVHDEFGSVRGLITMEDILEEIVGEITDEYDLDDRQLIVQDENTILVDAKLDIEEVEDFFHVEMPDGPYESIGGLIIHQIGRLPEAKESIEVDGIIFQVISATRRRIDKVKIVRRKSST